MNSRENFGKLQTLARNHEKYLRNKKNFRETMINAVNAISGHLAPISNEIYVDVDDSDKDSLVFRIMGCEIAYLCKKITSSPVNSQSNILEISVVGRNPEHVFHSILVDFNGNIGESGKAISDQNDLEDIFIGHISELLK